MGLKIGLCKFHKNSLSESLLEGKDVTLLDELTEHRAVSQKVSFQFFNGRYFVFHNRPVGASKYPFANSTRTDLAKGFLKGKM